MASFKDDADGAAFDFTLLPDMPLILENLNESLSFDDSGVLDSDAFYSHQPAWNSQDTPPYDNGLYSTPVSWAPPQARFVAPQDVARPIYSNPMNTLTPAQQERLRLIAMPDHLQYQNHNSPHSTAGSSTYKSGSVSSPDRHDSSRKRKTSHEEDDDDDDDEDGNNGQHPPVKKTAHNMIEKRYRTNLNDKIAALRDSVPSLRVVTNTKGEDGGEEEDLQGLTPAHKLNKATVLSKATEYIRHLEKRNTRLNDENASMKARIAAFEKLFMSGSMGINPAPQGSPYYRTVNDPYATHANNGHPTPGGSPSGMIAVPDDIRRMNAQAMMNAQIYVPQETYSPGTRQRQATANGWNGGGYFGKMMVGSLAGLMILEGFHESEQEADSPNARGLFAIPTQLLSILARALRQSTNINVLGFHSSSADTLAFVKLMIVLVTLLWVFVPSMFTASPKSKAGKQGSDHLSAAPSLASSIAVRQQAWLTAIQTVWVPRHNFFLEVAALLLKMIKLSLRNVIGWYGFALLTGITEQQETARIKAWGIALDSQLAGGDVQVNKTRLALTLLASATLPDTPASLMIKALHVKILLWELGTSGFFNFYFFHSIANKLARWKWNEAVELQNIVENIKADQAGEDIDPLPDHLVALLEHSCDEVLVDSITQRSYNLTYNLPTTHHAIGSSDGMDGVVEDFAIRSPLDAVSAWYSSSVLQRALTTSLSGKSTPKGNLYRAMVRDIDIAVKCAPIGSGAQIRALVARAVLVNEKRGFNIAAAIQILAPAAITSEKPTLTLINATTSIATLPDLRMSLNCAMAIAHLSRPGTPAPIAYTLINAIRPARLSLLGFASAFKLMETLVAHSKASLACSWPLENLAGTLRIWIGNGARYGGGELPKKTREGVVERCLGITKGLVCMGVEKDAGYETMSEEDVQMVEGC